MRRVESCFAAARGWRVVLEERVCEEGPRTAASSPNGFAPLQDCSLPVSSKRGGLVRRMRTEGEEPRSAKILSSDENGRQTVFACSDDVLLMVIILLYPSKESTPSSSECSDSGEKTSSPQSRPKIGRAACRERVS